VTAVAARPPVTDSSGGRPQGGVVRRRRSSRLVLVGVVLGVAGALAGLLTFREAGRRIEVIAIARTVPFGQALVVEDLRAATLPTDSGLAAMPWTAVDGVVGRTAGTDLLPGQVLTAAAVADAAPPAAGEALIGVAVKPGQLPGAGLSPRDEVLVVPTEVTPSGTSGVADAGGGLEPIRATVLRSGEVDAAGQRTVDLLVRETAAAEVAGLAASGQVALVLVARR
jgi:SAF domain-containing protein